MLYNDTIEVQNQFLNKIKKFHHEQLKTKVLCENIFVIEGKIRHQNLLIGYRSGKPIMISRGHFLILLKGELSKNSDKNCLLSTVNEKTNLSYIKIIETDPRIFETIYEYTMKYGTTPSFSTLHPFLLEKGYKTLQIAKVRYHYHLKEFLESNIAFKRSEINSAVRKIIKEKLQGNKRKILITYYGINGVHSKELKRVHRDYDEDYYTFGRDAYLDLSFLEYADFQNVREVI